MRSDGGRAGRTLCLRFTTPDAVTAFAIPSGIEYVLVRNASGGLTPNDIRINFDDDSASNYATLSPSPYFTGPISVGGGRILNTDGVGGSGVLEVIGWG